MASQTFPVADRPKASQTFFASDQCEFKVFGRRELKQLINEGLIND